jgi:hypothetical protein
LEGALTILRDRIAEITGKDEKKVTAQDMFCNCFDIPLFGLVNSNGLPHAAFPRSITGSAGLIYLPKTVTQVKIENRGISNAFCQPGSNMPGSHYTDYLEEGVFSCLGLFNVKQLKLIAQKKLGIEDESLIHSRIQTLYNLYLTGIWEGYKLLGYASTMRKGQQPYSLLATQVNQLPDSYIKDPAYILADEQGALPVHESIPDTIHVLEKALPDWLGRISGNWQEIQKMEL